MSFDDFPKSLKALIDIGLDWFDACRHPILHCDQLLSLSGDKEKVTKSLQLWIAIFILTLILQLPLLRIVGIEWETVGYHLPNFLITTAFVVLLGAIFHYGLRIYGILSRPADLIVMYTTLVGVYSPLFTLIFYPSMTALMGSLKAAKVQGLSFLPAIVFMFKSQAAQQQTYVGSVVNVTTIASSLASVSLIVLLARRVSIVYSVPKSKVLSSFAFSLSVLTPPVMAVAVLLIYFVMYSFIK